MSQTIYLHSRPRSGLGTQTGGLGGVSPPYKFAVLLLNTKEMRHFLYEGFTPLVLPVWVPRRAKAGAAGMEGENLHYSDLPLGRSG